MENREYSAGFMAQAVWFIEFKKVVQLISAGKTREEIRRACVEENLFGAPNPYRSGRMFGYLTNRAAAMDAELLELFLHSDMNTQKIINLICILKTDRLFYEFVYEVYREKAYLGIDTLSLGDISAYFHNKGSQVEKVSSWNESTFRRLRTCYTRALCEAGLVTPENKKDFRITPPLLDLSLEQYLTRANQTAILKAITGVA